MTAVKRKETGQTERSESSNVEDTLLWCQQRGLALRGNGSNEELNREQMEMIETLHANVEDRRTLLAARHPADADWCDYETCRRYLVARQWNLERAEAQLRSTLEWRGTAREGRGLEFWQSPKALRDPHSLSMRPVGWDREGRPICYTCYAEAHDRWDVEANCRHMELMIEACSCLIKNRVGKGLNPTASSRQWIWVVDFDGFGWRDQNPKVGLLTAKMMKHFPETLHMAVLINAPLAFRAMWKLISAVLDHRARQKVLFLNGERTVHRLEDRMGEEAVEWILAETKDNLAKRNDEQPKRYWAPPDSPDQHDARGMKAYVESEFYIKTPGDAWQQALLTTERKGTCVDSPRATVSPVCERPIAIHSSTTVRPFSLCRGVWQNQKGSESETVVVVV